MKSIYIEEVCQILNAESSRVSELAQSGQLPGARIGRSWVFIDEMVYEFLQKMILEQTKSRLSKGKISKSLHENLGIEPILIGAQYEPKRRGRSRKELPKLAS